MKKPIKRRIEKELTYSIKNLQVEDQETGNVEETPVDKVVKDAKNLRKKIARLEERFEQKTIEEGKRFRKEMKEREIKTTEMLAIFITLFTFISVNVSIFNRVQDVYTAAWFMLLMTACSVFLLSFLFIVIRSKGNWKIWRGLIISLVIIAFLAVVIISGNWNPKLNETKNDGQTINQIINEK